MTEKITKKDILSSLFWKLMERGGTQGISFLVSIILARLLLPEEYGLIALITIFITLANVFVQSGFNTALIQKKNADEKDFSTIFYVSLLIATLLYILLFFLSSKIANFYCEPLIVPVLRTLSIILFFGAVNSIQIAVISRNMKFQKLFYSSIGAIVISGIVGVVLAYRGFGIWALVGQQVSSQFITTVMLWFTVKWRPKLVFSVDRLKTLFSYGWNILVASLIDTLYLEIRSLIIGKIYSPEMLGYYNKGKQFPTIIVNNINGSIQSVMLPAYSSYQEDRKRVKDMVRRSIVTSSFFVFPLMIGLAIVAEPLVEMVLTEKWLNSVPFLQIYCASYALMPIQTANLQAIKALGYSNIFLRLEIIKKTIGLAILFISIYYGVYAIAWGVFLSNLISTVINVYPNIKLLSYSLAEQIKDIVSPLLLSLVMGIAVYSIKFINLPIWLLLILQVVMGMTIYFFLAWIFKLESFNYLINTIISFKIEQKEISTKL